MSPGYLGAVAALASAASWALSLVLWKRIGDVLPPLSLNLNKCLLGIVYLVLASLVLGFDPMDAKSLAYLGVSGLLGIALADTFFFASLIHLGSRISSVVGTLSPALTAGAAVVFLGEKPSVLLWIGALLTTCGVIVVMFERLVAGPSRTNAWRGLQYALLSLVCTTAAILLAKRGVASVPPLQATLIRMAFGVLGMSLWLAVKRRLVSNLAPLRDLQLLKKIAFVVFVGTFGGFWLFLVALKHADASVATILNSTTPLFILPMAAVAFRERISMKAIVGAVVSVLGVIAIFLI